MATEFRSLFSVYNPAAGLAFEDAFDRDAEALGNLYAKNSTNTDLPALPPPTEYSDDEDEQLLAIANDAAEEEESRLTMTETQEIPLTDPLTDADLLPYLEDEEGEEVDVTPTPVSKGKGKGKKSKRRVIRDDSEEEDEVATSPKKKSE